MALNLGNITFGIGPNLQQLVQATQQVFSFTGAMRVAASATAAAGQAANAAVANVQRLATGYGNIAAVQAALARQMGGGAAGAGGQQIRNVTALSEALRTLSSSATLVAGPLSGVATRISVLSTLTGRFGGELTGLIAGLAAGTYAFYTMAKGAIEAAKGIQRIEQTLLAVSASATIAATEMKYLFELSQRSGTVFTSLAQQYAQFTAAAKGTNLEGERTRTIFEAVVFAAQKLGLSTMDAEGALRALQQMISKGKITSEELRQQLGDRLPGAIQIMAQALGVTTTKLETMLKKGELGNTALLKFADALKKRYNIDTSQNIDTIVAAENRLTNARTAALDVIDKTLGISSAYMNILNKIAAAWGWVGENIKPIAQYIAVAAGALAGFAAPAILASLVAMSAAIVRIGASLIGVNAAAASLGGFALLIGRIALAVTGAYVATNMFNQSTFAVGQSHLKALPAVTEYIKAQETLKTTVRATTYEYIKQQAVQDALIQDQIRGARETITSLNAAINRAYADTGIPDKQRAEMVKRYTDEIRRLEDSVAGLGVKSAESAKLLKQLEDILQRQAKIEESARPDPTKELTNRQELAIKNAKDTVKELNETYAQLYKAPAAKELGLIQNEVNKQVENFRDVLSRAELPVAKVTELTDKYAEALKRVKMTELTLRTTVSAFQMLEGIFSRGLDKALDSWIETVLEGKDALEALRDTGKAVAADLLKTFMTLAALNPLKNALFGTNYQTLGGTAGTGGALGGIFSSLMSAMSGGASGGLYTTSSAAAVKFALGGIMSGHGALPLRKYGSGGIANSPQIAEFGEGHSAAEAYVPLPDGRRIPVALSGGGGGIELHIHESPNSTVTTQESTGKGGGPRLDVIIEDAVKRTIGGDLSQNGPITRMYERRFGLNAAKGTG